MRFKLIFSFVPAWVWILVLIATSILALGWEDNILPFLFFNLAIYFTLIRVSIVIHEFGHLIFAKIAGGIPRRMVIGKGFRIHKSTIFNVIVVIKNKITSGLAYATFDSLPNKKSRMLLYIIGGFITNLTICVVLYFVCPLRTNFIDHLNVDTLLFASNLVTGLWAIFPYSSKINGVTIPSDGKSLFKLLTNRNFDILEFNIANRMIDLQELVENQKFNEAQILIENIIEKHPELKLMQLNNAVVKLKLGKFQESEEIISALYSDIDNEDLRDYKPIILNHMAWINLINLEYIDALKNSREAYKLDNRSEEFRGTYAAALITNGHYTQGIELFNKDVSFNYPNEHTLSASIFLALAYFKNNNQKKTIKHLDFINKNSVLLGADLKILFEAVKYQINGLNQLK